MSLLSRMSALLDPTSLEPALRNPGLRQSGPARAGQPGQAGASLPAPPQAGHKPSADAVRAGPDIRRPFLAGPTGLGTAGLFIPAARALAFRPPPEAGGPATTSANARAATHAPAPAPAPAAKVPALYCPEPVRDDPALGVLVNERLVAWAAEVGIYPGRQERLRAADFGRLVMLTHPDTDDPDRLLAAAKCALAEWATDDHYCDDESLGASPELLGARLGLALSAVESAQLPSRYAPQWELAMRDDPVLVALRSAFDHLSRYAAPAQLIRLRHEIAGLFTAYNQEGSWRTAERTPAVWEYLSHRQLNSFLPCIALVDAVGGYQLPATEYGAPPVRRVIRLAALASTLVNDLYSLGKEEQASGVDFNLPRLIAAEEHCSLADAAVRAASVHDELVHTVEAETAALSLTGSPELKRFLTAVRAWLGGNHEWHRGSARYASGT